MKIWLALKDVLFGMARVAGAIAVIGFSVGVLVGRERRPDGSRGLADTQEGIGRGGGDDEGKVVPPEEAAAGMMHAIEAAAEHVIRDLEKRTMSAARLLEEAEEKIARLKEMLATCDRDNGERDDPHGASAAEMPEAAEAQEAPGELCAGGKRAMVFHLADEGLSVPEIARRVGIGRGEAQLILDLRARGDSQGRSRASTGQA